MGNLSGTFNKAAKFLFKTVVLGVIGIALTEPFIYALLHNNPGGLALMQALSPSINNFFDSSGVTNFMFTLSEMFGGGPAKAAVEMGGNLLNAPGVGNVFIPTL